MQFSRFDLKLRSVHKSIKNVIRVLGSYPFACCRTDLALSLSSSRRTNSMMKMKKLLGIIAMMCVCFFVAEAAQQQQQQLNKGSGKWEVVVENGGVSAMHMTSTYKNTVVMYDRSDYGASQLRLLDGRCRDDSQELALKHDCWAHSIEYDIASNAIRPLTIMTDTWCSSASFQPDGTLLSTGGYNDGYTALRYFKPCEWKGNATGGCDWVDNDKGGLKDNRWYASNQILPDGRTIVVGGRRAFTYEFAPSSPPRSFSLPFLQQTNKANVENNLYPFLHLSSDGNLFIFANSDSILFNYKNNKVVRTFPRLPGGPRNYPSSGSSVMLPLSHTDNFKTVEIMICGGAPDGSYESANAGKFLKALQTCGRMVITDDDANPAWKMEDMPAARVMGDMLILPTAEVLIINGAERGTAGWELGADPATAPFLYDPAANAGQRFSVLEASSIARLYHSSANVLADGRVLVGGSNPHVGYELSGVTYPTELRLETFSPYYLEAAYSGLRPSITGVSPTTTLSFGATFRLSFTVQNSGDVNIEVHLYAPPLTTHSFSMNQRMLVLAVTAPIRAARKGGAAAYSYTVKVTAPPNAVAAPPGYYLLFLVNNGIPGPASWVHLS